MTKFSCSVDMRHLPGCQAAEITTTRTSDNLFWCRAVLKIGDQTADLGSVVVGFDGTIIEHWHLGRKTLLGGHTTAFLSALAELLRQRGVIR